MKFEYAYARGNCRRGIPKRKGMIIEQMTAFDAKRNSYSLL